MKTVVAAALGECVHVSGVTRFLNLAESVGWRTVFLGPAVSVDSLIAAAIREKADLVGVSYRLTPETGERLLGELAEAAADLHEAGVRFVFGGTPPVAERAEKIGFFEQVFDGGQPPETISAYLKGQSVSYQEEKHFPQTTVERIQWKHPYPLLRHHFGLPTMVDTLEGIQTIAQSGILDVISLGIDQDAQENFFHPERQSPRRKGAGGVPVRSESDYRSLYQASRHGNFPLVRTYSGTDDFIRLAAMYVDTINTAWCAIPLFWFNLMDGRGPWDLEGSIREHQKVMAYYGEKEIPVEVNEPHHWGMRDAPDVIFVVSAYLSAYNARSFGVKNYIAQLMFNSPPGTSDSMDLAKMLAVMKMISPLGDDINFQIWRQTRTGLLSFPLEPEAAKAHLSASVYLQMALKPHIIHVVGYVEADHAASAEDVIVSCKLARRVMDNALLGQPDMTVDGRVQKRKNELVREAKVTLNAIRSLAPEGVKDPFTDPTTLTQAVTKGIMDAPQLKNNPFGHGRIRTRIMDGTCVAVDIKGRKLSEQERLSSLNKEGR